ncbi:MAG: UbiA family prenyltransferase, partial [Actinomycetota bacterium]|nr:UbiA family prenyltransferase [Actinomycetota bacterium]
TAIATALAVSSGLGARSLWVAAAFLTGQLSVGWSNDWIDAARDARNGRRDKPVGQGLLSVDTVRTAALTALAVCVPLSLALGRRAGTAHLLAVGSALAYDLGLKATVLSPVPYAVSFGLVPNVVALAGRDPRPAPWWSTAAGALLGVGAHLANALPDLEADRATGIVGLPHRLGRRRAAVGCSALLLGATALLVWAPGPPGPAHLAGLAAAVGLTAAGLLRARRRPSSRAPFLAAVGVALVDVGLLVARGAPRRAA